ncbi:RNA polymerase sigma-H factor Sigma-30 [Fibrella aestuarina BUZ 2]|uniref:RNA polymerase sigma-H factor Sigma-30 n=1 Tax=Fibrella aestuarina BUZ 2 TaxID=1166018 RepID=I0K880_9BACT|nr:sigma-70 family RNA polymerase sigma factor [Fibrella aestuarina]CCH00333.1 RNA polymerase sigma-H factor Sigma-30 [Fibrella aestuarina BUZ 2]
MDIPADDITYLERLRQGHEPTFRWLVETYQQRVFRTALAIVDSAEDAEDVAQEVFEEVFKTVGAFRGDASLATWLYRITTSRALKKERDRKRKKRFAFLTTLFDDTDTLRHDPPDHQTPQTTLERDERTQLIHRAVATLPETQRIAFTLHYQEELSYAEVASILETSVAAVESLLFRARQSLRKKVSPVHL